MIGLLMSHSYIFTPLASLRVLLEVPYMEVYLPFLLPSSSKASLNAPGDPSQKVQNGMFPAQETY